MLEVIRTRLGCGRIRPNSTRDRALVLVVRNRDDLLERVIPFFEHNPILSAKHADFEKFAGIVRELALGHHRTPAGFRRLLEVRPLHERGGALPEGAMARARSYPESSETARQTRPLR